MNRRLNLLSTTYPELDEIIGGLRPGSITSFGCYDVFGGKSLILELMLRAAASGTNILYFSAEDTQKTLRIGLLAFWQT